MLWHLLVSHYYGMWPKYFLQQILLYALCSGFAGHGLGRRRLSATSPQAQLRPAIRMNVLNTSKAALSCGFRSRLRLPPARRRPQPVLRRKEIDMPQRSKGRFPKLRFPALGVKILPYRKRRSALTLPASSRSYIASGD